MADILVIEDDPGLCEAVALALEKAGHRVVRAPTLVSAQQALRERSFSLVVCDIYLPEATGLDLLQQLSRQANSPKVLLMTARGSLETAALAAQLGAADYIAKPFSLGELVEKVDAFLKPPPPPAEPEIPPGELLVGSHPSMVEVYKAIARVAPLSVPVLILGETGSGKELVARAIHAYSPRKDKPLVTVNCAAIPDTLLESELFGHLAGAFTDARKSRSGAVVSAHGGTLFLDEIGETSPAFQAKLLRFLEDGLVRPLGSDRSFPVDVRVVAATHRPLPRLQAEKRFRQDLFFRLAAYVIQIPPLRERASDIPALVAHFRRKIVADLGLTEAAPASQEVLAILAARPWPGNVRQLQQVIRRMLIDTGGLTDALALARILASLEASSSQEAGSLEAAEREQIRRALEQSGGNRSQAARLLGIDRKTLLRKMKRFGMESASEGAEG